MDALFRQESGRHGTYIPLEYHWLLLWNCDQGDVAMPAPTRAEIAAAERAYSADPNNEETCRVLIAAYQAAGRRDDALRLCLSLQERLEAAGTVPSVETRRLMNSLAAAPVALPRPVVSRRVVLGFAALGVLVAVGGMRAWKWAPPATEPSVVDAPTDAKWNEEGNRLAGEAATAYYAGRYAEGKAKAQQAEGCFWQGNNASGAAHAVLIWGECAQVQGDFQQAKGLFAEGSRLHRLYSGKESIEHALELSGTVALRLGQFAEAQKLLDQSLALSWQPNEKNEIDRGNILAVMCSQGQVAAETGQFATAAKIYAEALGYAKQWNTDPMFARLTALIGTNEMEQGHFETSRQLLTKARNLWQAQPQASPRWKAVVANRFAALELAEQNPAAAQKHLVVSLPIYQQVGDKCGEADTRLLRGQAFLMQNKLADAETELNAAQTFFDSQSLLPRAERCRRVRAPLDAVQQYNWMR